MKKLSIFIVLLAGILTMLNVTAENQLKASSKKTDRALNASEANSKTELYWYDGKKQRKLWLEPNLIAEFSTANNSALSSDGSIVDSQSKSLVKENANLRIWEVTEDLNTVVSNGNKKSTSSKLSPVLRSMSSGGSIRALPGGVLLILNSELSADQVEDWLSQKGLEIEKQLSISKYAYFIATSPGLASLELANELIENDSVETPFIASATPNWWSERSKR